MVRTSPNGGRQENPKSTGLVKEAHGNVEGGPVNLVFGKPGAAAEKKRRATVLESRSYPIFLTGTSED